MGTSDIACFQGILLMVSCVGSNNFGSNIGFIAFEIIQLVITIYGFNIDIAKHTAAKSYKY